jgi:hypothetical protein
LELVCVGGVIYFLREEVSLSWGFFSSSFEKEEARKLSGVVGYAGSVYSLSYSLFN